MTAVALGICAVGAPAHAQMDSFAHAAAQARQSVVTVRVTLPIEEDAEPGNEDPLAVAEPTKRVTVCTGLVVGPQMIVTAAFASSDSVIRVTTPTGGRDVAQLRVIDEYTGLMLIETSSLKLTPFPLSDKAAEAGQWTIAAAGWGAEDPVVSFGVISGVDREQPGYPPLLQLDVRTLDTSSGAAVISTTGKLQGIVVAVEDMRPRGLTYAVPTPHIQRLLRVWKTQAEQEPNAANPKTIVLRRRRPEAGLVLRGDNQDGMPLVIVQRVHEGGPAERAGFAVGDEVISVGGVRIRSVYEAVRPVLSRQPGDTLTYRVRNEDGMRDLKLVLGGGVALPSGSLRNVARLIRPKLDVEGLPSGVRSRPRTPEFLADTEQDNPIPADKRGRELLQKAQEAHLQVIAAQQQKLRELERLREEDQRQLEQLKKELEALKAMVEQPAGKEGIRGE